jgi:signal transduction histidine kinase
MDTPPEQPAPAAATPEPAPPPRRLLRRPGGFLGGMRVRKKVLFLHTLFSLALAAVLLVPLRPAITEVVEQAEASEARVVLRLVLAREAARGGKSAGDSEWLDMVPDGRIHSGNAEDLGLSPAVVTQAKAAPGRPIAAFVRGQEAGAVAYVPTPDGSGTFWSVTVTIPEARHVVTQLYVLTAAVLLAVYALVAAALELFVLPQHVYGPIGRMLDADAAVQEGNKEQELIPDAAMPADELGEIMRSRNRSILALRRHEAALAEAIAELGRVANDLKRKNHLLEAAQRNLADADRLASLGMMSAGIAHELNTPLAVLKGLVEKLNNTPGVSTTAGRTLDPASAALMLRVVKRLERLGDSLLDFARVRPPQTSPVAVRSLVDEALTLVRLDRDASGVDFANLIPESLTVECDGDRMVQVLVNLLRNAADALNSNAARTRATTQAVLPFERPDSAKATPTDPPQVQIDADRSPRGGRDWVSVTITDNGPGIDPDMLSRLFEPFASTRLDAHGTGLGLAVAEGIVREHGGLILARNRPDRSGAVFEIMLPARAAPYAEPAPEDLFRPAIAAQP